MIGMMTGYFVALLKDSTGFGKNGRHLLKV
jgi:hypothetical protein